MANTILISTGGTGGHVFPGLEVAREFSDRGYQVEWLGTRRGLESRLVPEHGIPIHYFPIEGVRGKGRLALLFAPLNIIRGLWYALRIVRKIRPSLVVGLGGFVSGPAGIAAFLLRTPLVIHEQNAIAGTTNKILAKFASIVLSAFPVEIKKSQVIGNPVRLAFERIEQETSGEREAINVLVLGGSRGARALNLRLPQVFKNNEFGYVLNIRHQCGDSHAQETRQAYNNAGIEAEVLPFIKDIPQAFAWADLLVCRAGALTVSEVAASGRASVMVPYPYAIDDHQTHNAQFLERVAATYIVQESEFDKGKLDQVLSTILSDKEKIKQMSAKAKSVAKLGVAKTFVDICESIPGVAA